MAVKVIGNSAQTEAKRKRNRATSSEMKPLAKEYIDKNPTEEGVAYPIYSGKVTAKGFLLMECEKFAVLFPAGIEIASVLLDDILPKLNNKKGNQLVAILSRANRFGADIGTEDSIQVYYCFNEAEETFFTSKEKPSKSKFSEKKLSLQDFGTLTE